MQHKNPRDGSNEQNYNLRPFVKDKWVKQGPRTLDPEWRDAAGRAHEGHNGTRRPYIKPPGAGNWISRSQGFNPSRSVKIANAVGAYKEQDRYVETFGIGSSGISELRHSLALRLACPSESSSEQCDKRSRTRGESRRQKELLYLGHRVTSEGIGTDPEKVAAIAELEPPSTVKELRQYLGVASWYRRFVPDFAKIVKPLNDLLRKGSKWEWTQEHQMSFEEVKARLVADPVLACPDFNKTFTLQTDASDYGIGAILTQDTERGEKVISYSSRTLKSAEKNYSTTEKECLAIVWAIRKLKPYLEGYHFKVVTDHMALKWLNSIESPSGRIARWALELQQYDFEIAYRKGQLNVVADALSRQPVPETHRNIKETSAAEASAACSWFQELCDKIRTQPQKYPDYVMEGENLYRSIPHRAGSEDVVTWKMCVPRALRETVLKENHDSPAAGHVGGRRTIARLAARYYFLAEMGIRQQFTAPYTPQENPTERANKTVKTMIAQFAGQDQRTWDEKWPEIMLAVNSSISESTGYTPSFLTQGREPRLPSALYDRETLGTGRATETPDENAQKLKEVFEIVRRHLEKASQDQARYDGPYQVEDFVSPVICTIRNVNTKKERTIHVGELKQEQTQDTNEQQHQADATEKQQH
ncbi:uncharacterized protein [Drosophila takahashii]|uniref:uncharacterized protein n=1 Tax=Drosophila takahashii TaxID=29030 RepID=UPI003898E0FF